MKIFLLPVKSKLQPSSQAFEYPSNNPDYGVEQDFLKYVSNNFLLVNSPERADWHYLPVFWTRWHLNHDYGKSGLKELRLEVNKAMINPKKTFTICQYDDGPLVNIKSATVFLSSRKTGSGIDIPLLRNKLKTPLIKPRKKYMASFVGRLDTHPIRKKMANALSSSDNVLISDGDSGQKFFVDKTLQSYIALCPRGYGGSSFRFFEAMQLGVVPVLIGDKDTRPFKKFIDWDGISFFLEKTDQLPALLEGLDKKPLIRMGKLARTTYIHSLSYGKWGNYVIKELESVI